MNFKLKIKKKYIGVLATVLSLYSLVYFLQEIYIWATNNGFNLILLLISFISTIYTIIYWIDLNNKQKLAEEISHQVIKDGNLTKQGEIKDHLYSKTYEEYYIFPFLKRYNKSTNEK